MAVPQKKPATPATPPNVATMPSSSNTGTTGDTDTTANPKSPSLVWGPLGGPSGISPRNKALIRALKTANSLAELVAALQADPAFFGASNLVKAGNVSNHLRAVRKVMTEAGLGHLVPTFGKTKGTVDTKALAELFEAQEG